MRLVSGGSAVQRSSDTDSRGNVVEVDDGLLAVRRRGKAKTIRGKKHGVRKTLQHLQSTYDLLSSSDLSRLFDVRACRCCLLSWDSWMFVDGTASFLLLPCPCPFFLSFVLSSFVLTHALSLFSCPLFPPPPLSHRRRASSSELCCTLPIPMPSEQRFRLAKTSRRSVHSALRVSVCLCVCVSVCLSVQPHKQHNCTGALHLFFCLHVCPLQIFYNLRVRVELRNIAMDQQVRVCVCVCVCMPFPSRGQSPGFTRVCVSMASMRNQGKAGAGKAFTRLHSATGFSGGPPPWCELWIRCLCFPAHLLAVFIVGAHVGL